MENSEPIELTDETFEQEVIYSKVLVLVDFWATWCTSCQAVALILDKMAELYAGRLKVCKMNIEEGQTAAMRYGVMSVPTLNFFKDGNMIDRVTGVTPNYESDLKQKIESHLD